MTFIKTEQLQLKDAKQNLPGFDACYLNIVDYILKITNEIWEERAIWVVYDTYTKDVLVHSGANKIVGIEKVVVGTIKTLAGFPDRKMGAETVIWAQDNEKQFFSSHRIGSTATNTGNTFFGKATGKKVFFRTIVDCMIQDNKIYEEWLVRDNLHLLLQLGFDPVEMAKKDTRYDNSEVAFSKSRSTNSTSNSGTLTADESTPEGLIYKLLHSEFKQKKYNTLNNYYSENAILYGVCDNDVKGVDAIKNYIKTLLESFQDLSLTVERITTNQVGSKTEVAARWYLKGEISEKNIFDNSKKSYLYLPIISHYHVKGGKITEEWLVYDGFDALCQIYS